MNQHLCDVVIVAGHLFEEMPEATPEEAKYIRWKQFSDLITKELAQCKCTIIYQLEYVQQSWYLQHSQRQWPDSKFGPRQANTNLVIKPNDHITTSSAQTKDIIRELNPNIVMVCGLHKDFCIKGILLDIYTDKREYFISDRLSFTKLATARAINSDS